MDETPDARVRTLCRRQGGAFSLPQAVGVGMSRSTVRDRVRAGRYERVGSGVYVDAAVEKDERTWRFVALLDVGRGACLGWNTGGDVWDLSSTPPSKSIHLVVRCTCPHECSGVVVHRSRTLAEGHITRVDGLPVTTPARTLCDLAGESGPVRLRRLVSEAVRFGAEYRPVFPNRLVSGR